MESPRRGGLPPSWHSWSEDILDLSDSLAKAAKDAGLLAPEAREKIIAEALRRQNFDGLLSVADRVEAAGIPPMSADELNAEIQSCRMERRRAGV
jgi:ribosomal protein L12E/L44/L45/RPP1/RPP2